MASADDLWLVDFGQPYPGVPVRAPPGIGAGPPDPFGPGFPFLIVVPLTTARRGLSLHIEVEAGAGTGLDTTSYVQCELIRSIDRSRRVVTLDMPASLASACGPSCR